MPVNKINVDSIGTASSKQSIASGANAVSSSFNLDETKALVAGLSVDFGATPDANVRLEVQTSPDDSNWDTVAYAQFEIDYSAGSTLQKSMPINADTMYARIKVSNLDSADSVSVWAFITKTWGGQH